MMRVWTTLGLLLGLAAVAALVAWQGAGTVASALASPEEASLTERFILTRFVITKSD